MSDKIIITRYKDNIITAIHDGKRITDLDVCKEDNKSDLGSIYVGRVMDIVKNINAAFIEYKKGQKGYFSIDDNKNIIFLNKKNTNKLCQGDLILVRVAKEAVKTKDPVLSSKLELAGKYIVLTSSDLRLTFSKQINDNDKKLEIRKAFEGRYNGVGFIIRTNAMECEIEDIISEANKLYEKYSEIITKAPFMTAYTKMYEIQDSYVNFVRDRYNSSTKEVVTDIEEIYEKLNYLFDEYTIRLYNDEMLSLIKLYSIESQIDKALQKRVWLDSGAYLIIENTEALNVIDVNTGKCIKGKSNDKVFYNVNLEAAMEVARQIRIRNLSGIIIIDFISMSDNSYNEMLMKELRNIFSKEKIKTNVIDMTPLGLVELTRKKEKAPLHEMI